MVQSKTDQTKLDSSISINNTIELKMKNQFTEFELSSISRSVIEANIDFFDDYQAFELFLEHCSFGSKDYKANKHLGSSKLKSYDHMYHGFWTFKVLNPITGEEFYAQFKPKQPRIINGKPLKYEVPKGSSTPFLYYTIPLLELGLIFKKNGQKMPDFGTNNPTSLQKWESIKNNPKIPLFLTEGGKKGMCLASHGYAGLPSMSITTHSVKADKEKGETAWDTPLKPELLWMLEGQKGRTVYIAFDRADTKASSRRAVNKQTSILAKKLEKQGCKVLVLDWKDKECKGIDDFIHKYGEKGLKRLIKKALPYKKFKAKMRALATRKFTSDKEICQQYVDQNIFQEAKAKKIKAVFLKSQQGTGKTQAMADFIASRQFYGESTINLNHRRTLSKALAKRFGLRCHLDVVNEDNRLESTMGISLCVDSVLRINEEEIYDYMIIDEAEQVLWHMLSANTEIANYRTEKIDRFFGIGQNCLDNEGMLLFSDADMSDVTVSIIQEKYGLKDDEIMRVDNTYSPFENKRKLFNYQNVWDLKKALQDAIKAGERVIIHCGGQKVISTNGTKNLEEWIVSELKIPEDQVLRIDRESISDPDDKAFAIVNRLEEIRDHKIVLCSNTISTGVSLDVEVVGAFDKVFGIFYGTFPLEDFEQSLERYRGHCNRHVFIEKTSNSKISFGGQDKKDLVAHLNKQITLSTHYCGLEEIEFVVDQIKSYSKFAARINGDYKSLRDSFLEHEENKGYEIVEMQQLSKEERKEGREKAKEIKEHKQEIHAKKVAQKNVPSKERMEKLDKKRTRTKDELLEEQRGKIHQKYGDLEIEDLEGFILNDMTGALYPQLRLRFWLTVGEEQTRKHDKKVGRKRNRRDGGEKAYFLDYVRLANTPKVQALKAMKMDTFIEKAEDTLSIVEDYIPKKGSTINHLKEVLKDKEIKKDIKERVCEYLFCSDDIEEWSEGLKKYSDSIKIALDIDITKNKSAGRHMIRLKGILAKIGIEIVAVGRYTAEDGKQKRYYMLVPKVRHEEWSQIFCNWNLEESDLRQAA